MLKYIIIIIIIFVFLQNYMPVWDITKLGHLTRNFLICTRDCYRDRFIWTSHLISISVRDSSRYIFGFKYICRSSLP